MPAALHLFADLPRPPRPAGRRARVQACASESAHRRLASFAARDGVTPILSMLAAWHLLLARYSRQGDVLAGVRMASRDRASLDAESVADGPAAHIQLVRATVRRDATVREFLATTQRAVLAASDQREQSETSPFELALEIVERDGGLDVELTYDADLWSASTAERMVRNYLHTLDEIGTHPDRRIGSLSMLTSEERRLLLDEYIPPARVYDFAGHIAALVAGQVAKTPDAIAIIDGTKTITYREWNDRANQLARYLARAGVRTEDRVAICLPRSIDLVIGLLGVLKAGAAYVPIDAAYPRERRRFMTTDTRAVALLTSKTLRHEFDFFDGRIVLPDHEGQAIADESTDEPEVDISPEQLAYIIYTSGSTGIPKGVMIRHGSAVVFLRWARDSYRAEEWAGVLASTSLCFDISFFEIFGTLTNGGTIILAENALELPALPARHQVTLINTVPSSIAELVRQQAVPPSTLTVNIAGEPLKQSVVQNVYACGVGKVYNCYGPSEDTSFSTAGLMPIDPAQPITIGRVLPNSQVYLLDPDLNLVAAGAPGELYIGGDGLARGYFNRARLTAERFVPNPFSPEPGARMYCTGDLARYTTDGDLDYLGRLDDQVKIHGFRIETGEIEAALLQQRGVKDAVVVVRARDDGDKQLVAYVVGGADDAAHRRGGQRLGRAEPPSATARTFEAPASFAQQRLWTQYQHQPANPAYVITSSIRLTGRVDRAALERALTEIVRRHESLRTTFAGDREHAIQQIHGESAFRLDVVTHPEASIAELVDAQARATVDLEAGPLIRATLVEETGGDCALLVAIHHIVADLWSMGVFWKELAALYNAFVLGLPSPLPPLTVQYAAHSTWQHEWLRGDVQKTQSAYWRRQLQDAPAVVDVPSDRPRPPVRDLRGATESIRMDADLLGALRDLSRREGVTLFMTLLAAFKVLVHRYSDQRDIVVGSPITGRHRGGIEGLIGFFVNMLPLRTDVARDLTFLTLLARVRRTCLDAYAHQDLPFEVLLDELRIERSPGHAPLFQIVFVLQNAPRTRTDFAGLTATPIAPENTTAKFDLALTMYESPDGLTAALGYSTDIFDRATAQRMVRQFATLLAGIAAAPDTPIGRLPLLTADERLEAIDRSRATVRTTGAPATIPAIFEQQVLRTPNAIAVSCDGVTATYRDLNRRANQLARHLRDRGVTRGTPVGICLERSADMIVAILAVLKAGGAYVPFEPAYPRERLSWLANDARIEVVITTTALANQAGSGRAHAVILDAPTAAIGDLDDANPGPVSSPADTAYIIYTSGSTGQPKGVPVTHHNVVRLMRAAEPWFTFGETDVWTVFHSYAFDFSVWEIWGALLYGGRLVIVPYWISRTPEAFHDLLIQERVTVLNQTPSAFRQLIDADRRSAAPPDALSLRYIIFGGEALELPMLEPWFARHGDAKPELVNMYGITETTVHVTWRPIRMDDVRRQRRSVIGKPLPDLSLFVLDDQQDLVPVGAIGEIHVGGVGLANGYLHRPAATAQRFVPDPFSTTPGARLYRSGDLGRRLADGDLEYIGRSDDQVKIRGFRIELGEVESALSRHAGVRDAVVIARADASGIKTLRAYFIPAGHPAPTAADLHEFLAQNLPGHMIPASFVPMEAFPLNTNGKLDRRALPEPPAASETEDFSPPRDETEDLLAGIWAQVLGVDRVGIDDGFFALGGDSIRSIQIRARARDAGLELSLQDLFRSQTIRKLSGSVTRVSPAAVRHDLAPFALITADERRLVPAGVDDAYPLGLMQAGLLFHSELRPESAVYHDIFSYHVRAPFDRERFRRAVATVMSRHDTLRASVDWTPERQPLQVIWHDVEPPVSVDSIGGLGSDEQQRVIAQWIQDEKRRPFDWRQPPLFRIQIHERSAERFQCTLSFHHAILDGWSVALFFTDLFTAYQAAEGTQRPGSGAVASFRDFIRLEREALASQEAAAFWKAQVADAPLTPLSRQDTGRERRAPEIRSRRVEIPELVSRDLQRIAQDSGVPLKTVLLAAHLHVLGQVGEQDDVVSGFVSNGRPESRGGERALGLFLNTLPIRLRLDGGSWLDLIRGTFDAENGIVPFRRYPIAEIQKFAGGRHLFEAVFNFVHFHVYQELAGLEALELLEGTTFEETDFPLLTSFSMSSGTGAIHLNLTYDASLLTDADVQRLHDEYAAALRAIAANPLAACTPPRRRIESAPPVTERELREQLGRQLPDYMIPARFVFLEQLPLLPNGKVHKSQLPEPEWPIHETYVEPASALERRIAATWSEVLQAGRVGRHSNFFAAGADSLKAIRVILRLREQLQMDLPLRILFEAPTVEALAMAIAERQAAADREIEALAADLNDLPEDEVRALLANHPH